MHKTPSKLETVNDIDGRITNFFMQLRERPFELVQQIELTPWSQDEFQRCRETAGRLPPSAGLPDRCKSTRSVTSTGSADSRSSSARSLRALRNRSDALGRDTLPALARWSNEDQFEPAGVFAESSECAVRWTLARGGVVWALEAIGWAFCPNSNGLGELFC